MFRVTPEGRTGSVGEAQQSSFPVNSQSALCRRGLRDSGNAGPEMLAGGAFPEPQDLTGVPWTPSVERGIGEERP